MARQARAKHEQRSEDTALQAAKTAALAGLEKKGEEVTILDVRGLASYTDFLVLMSATSDRQVNAIADAVDEVLRKAGHRPIGVEGLGSGNWILIDSGDVVVHVFQQQAREFYDLDSLWADAKRVHVDERPSVSAVVRG